MWTMAAILATDVSFASMALMIPAILMVITTTAITKETAIAATITSNLGRHLTPATVAAIDSMLLYSNICILSCFH
uniref:Secreted protein n=1 Tax=Romanomermis culicivorax TaxID=13658 RepID=A0A915JF44_ROMCU